MKPAVLFDLGNTIAAYYRPDEFRPILEEAIGGVLHELHRLELARITLDAAIAAAVRENREATDFRFVPMAERFERIFRITLVNDPLLANALCARFLQPIFRLGRIYDDTQRVLTELRAIGVPTAIVSNAPWGSPPQLWMQEFGRLGLAAAVDAIVLCGDVGWRKPARQIFELAAAKLRRSCSECMFVGDDLQWDIEGSQAVGMRPVLLDRDGRHVDFQGERIRGLDEVLTRIEANI